MKIRIDKKKCGGCELCALNCSYYHEGLYSKKKSRIYISKNDHNGTDFPVTCAHCESAPCVQVCPADCFINTDKGNILLDATDCTCCYSCVDACPNGAVLIHPELKTVMICDLCDGNPQCVNICPMGALSYN